MRTGAANHLKTVGGCLKDLDHLSDHVQKRIFQKHFSTKEQLSREFGTYSMKLFGEHYLGGEVSFTSTQEKGTTFTFRLPRSSRNTDN